MTSLERSQTKLRPMSADAFERQGIVQSVMSSLDKEEMNRKRRSLNTGGQEQVTCIASHNRNGLRSQATNPDVK